MIGVNLQKLQTFRKNTGENLCYLELSKDFLYVTLKWIWISVTSSKLSIFILQNTWLYKDKSYKLGENHISDKKLYLNI